MLIQNPRLKGNLAIHLEIPEDLSNISTILIVNPGPSPIDYQYLLMFHGTKSAPFCYKTKTHIYS